MQKTKLRMGLDLRATLSACVLVATLAASGTAVRAETRVFVVEGAVAPALTEDAPLPDGYRFRTGAGSVVVLTESWVFGNDDCGTWTVVGSNQRHTVRSTEGKPCPETNNAEKVFDQALARQSGTSQVVFRAVAQAGVDKGDTLASKSVQFGWQLREKLRVSEPHSATPMPESKPQAPPLKQGVYTIQQRSNGRYVDAHVNANRDFALVTRDRQGNDTQRWILRRVGGNVYTIQQRSNGRYVDAHVTSNRDFALVTRDRQRNNTQRWILTWVSDNVYTIQQRSNRRYVDAHVNSNRDFALVTRDRQDNATQQWVIRPD